MQTQTHTHTHTELQLKYGDEYSKRVAICAPTGIAATHIQGKSLLG